MNENHAGLGLEVIQYSAQVGADPLLVQGAGGNVSWKIDNSLWIKASGTWLADAVRDNIFVEVDLNQLRDELDSKNFAAVPHIRNGSILKPSIETLLHALMPHPVVAHLHAIDVLSHLVRKDCDNTIASKLNELCSWSVVEYQKPGALLAEAVADALAENPKADVVFMKNHGLVIGGSTPGEISSLLKTVSSALKCEITLDVDLLSRKPSAAIHPQYRAVDDPKIHQLAIQDSLFCRLHKDWALYPDHVVFLGARAYVYDSWDDFDQFEQLPELIFIRNSGVYAKQYLNKAKSAQLRCYYDVLSRQCPSQQLVSLDCDDIRNLLSWDAEQYRMQFAK
ncbi:MULTISPECIES: class II aldolase/adducin family protein [Pseudomonas]|uniref:Class II aldolase n=1 Tax=Pseudomonas quercus TaxID=2722792 RepID=A0ABX0YFF5_9PSED|nr:MULTISPECIES: class II aldolase/adducin family protein [Pseudomonas]MBF7143479.1 class II aldolase [Pseudomonas sp. LY10J]NJP02145.1 class II aldolase [Pseudomonas quercus]